VPERSRAWLAILAGVALLLPSRASVPAALTIVLVWAASRWASRAAARGMEVTCSLPAWASHGDVVEAGVDVRCRSRAFLPWMEVDVPSALALGRREPHREVLPLRPGGTVTVRMPLRCIQRGRHHVGPPTLRIGDAFGLAERIVRPDDRAEVTVFPETFPLAALGLPAEFPFVELPDARSLVVDPASVVGVRDYVAGDPLSAIHWPATARSQRLVVKEHERGESRDTIVCLDLSASGYPRGEAQVGAELAISVAASVLQHTIVVQRLPAGLRCAGWARDPTAPAPDVNLPPRADRAHLRRMLEVLALASTGGERPVAHVLSGLGIGMSTGTTLLVVTGRLDAHLGEVLLGLRRSGATVTVALTGPSAHDVGLTAGHLWMPIYHVAAPQDLPGFAA
jgi:uncharacterized protein (DUF58 family)